MTTTRAPAVDATPSIGPFGPVTSLLLRAGLLYVGASALIPQYIGIDRGPIGTPLLISGLIALVGWRHALDSAVLRRYLLAAFLFGSWLIITSVAAWSRGSGYRAAGLVVWACVLIPGVAQVVRDEVYRRPLMVGIVFGATVYGITVALRLATGRSATDAVTSDGAGNVGLLLGKNRNIVSMGMIVAGAILLERPWRSFPDLFRLPLLGLAFLTVAYSGGRSALIGLAMFALLLGLFQPGLSLRVRRILVGVLCGLIFVIVSQAMGGDAAKSSDRLLNFFNDKQEKSLGDQARELDGRKAWHIGLDNPVFGIGTGNYQGAFNPVLNDAPTLEVRHRLDTLTAHNTYGLMLAEDGFPGVLSFIAMFAVLAWAVLRRSYDRATRFFGAGVVTVFVMLAFDGLLGTALYVPMMLLLGTLIAVDAQEAEAPIASSLVR